MNAAAALANAGTPPASTPPAGGGTPPAGGTPPVGTPPAGTPPAGGTPPTDAWHSSFPEGEVKTWVTAKGWKDPVGLAESAYNLEKLIGHEKAGRTLVVPKDDAPPEEWAAFNQKLGVPANAEAYKLPVPEGQDPAFAKTAASWMHEAGIPPRQAEKLAGKWNEYMMGQAGEQQKQAVAKADKEFADTVAAWGAQADANLEMGRRAASQLIPAASPQERQEIMSKMETAIGTSRFLAMFAEMGKHLGEHGLQGNNQPGQYGTMTPAQAQAKITELKQDREWSKAYIAGDKNKLAEMTKLQEIAAGVRQQ